MGPRSSNRGPGWYVEVCSPEMPEAPTIALSANPDRDSALVQVPAVWELIERVVIRILATLAVVVPPVRHFTRD
ncbi:MAG: hypothetical protein A2665_00675 [Candidatus Zambryskibacteria bacterium RIFCSPHIGHO2_01_FULL_46_30]|uniref:Uncharacterized protein n=1 Tax=Candidatus Zambryskibacteria bacterium RIFCSPHIGHO2_01_FULL_46_30 TaxID=1802739 RepID=A0A1G2T0F6_9BACT|nr:MAG: hypothetical protein A2665_00675 [Candidatus Zambryskibacteria bacterium RIFCSPHIGHO2_01_FULL_46_30]OHB05246.1 MAG: hypothetical protein A3B22_03120 [Candidatus Zambryskibacteria bacterium RIFCSPLOWO2_01_FULL_47_33]